MGPELELSFPKYDCTFRIALDGEQAPQAAEMLWGLAQTRFVTRAVHAIYAGPAVLLTIPPRHGEPRGGQAPIENEIQRPEPGDVLLLPPADDPEEDIWGEPGREEGVTLAIFYGEKGRTFAPSGWQAAARVGRVVGNTEAVRKVCRAIRFEGAAEVCVARAEATADAADEAAILYTDGASLGNPGPAGAGFVLTTADGRVLAEGSIPLEPTTVNVAEYRALVAGLTEALRRGVRRLELRMDSELVIKQLRGEYRVKARALIPIFIEAKRLTGQFEEFTCRHVPREQNQRADELAGAAAKRMKEMQGNRGD